MLFDIAATGVPVLIGWTAPEADEAFLAFDRDHDGAITSGAELFGTATPLRSGVAAGNGFVALAELDDDRSGSIDASDAVWSSLLLWRDANHDGVSQPAELTPIVATVVRRIDLAWHWSGRRDRFGNVFRYESQIRLATHGSAPVVEPLYDIFFVRVSR